MESELDALLAHLLYGPIQLEVSIDISFMIVVNQNDSNA